MSGVRITVPPSRHRVQITVWPDHIDTVILDIPDGHFTFDGLPLIVTEQVQP